MITANDLRAIAGTNKRARMQDEIAAAFNKHASSFGVNNPKRIAEFLANVSHETGGFTQLEESLNYSVAGILKTFGRHRISVDDANRLGRAAGRPADQRAIANLVYGGAWGKKQLGNTEPNDGWDYRGSGPGQVTGRANFANIEKESGLPVVSNPDILRQADSGMKAALILWQKWGLNELADNGQTTAIRKRWNGGSLGLKEVKEARARAGRLSLSVPAARPESLIKKPAPEPVVISPDWGKPINAPAPAKQGLAAFFAAIVKIFTRRSK